MKPKTNINQADVQPVYTASRTASLMQMFKAEQERMRDANEGARILAKASHDLLESVLQELWRIHKSVETIDPRSISDSMKKKNALLEICELQKNLIDAANNYKTFCEK